MAAEPIPLIVLGLVGLLVGCSILLPVLIVGFGMDVRKAARGVFAAFGAGSTIAGGWLLHGARTFLAEAASAQGEVVRVAESSTRDAEGNTSVAYAPVVRFRPAGGPPAEFSGHYADPPTHNKGDIVTVLYLPGAPEKARIRSFTNIWLAGTVFTAVGGALLVFATALPRRPT